MKAPFDVIEKLATAPSWVIRSTSRPLDISNIPTSSLPAADVNASLSSAVMMTSETDDVSRSPGARDVRDVTALVMLQTSITDESPVTDTSWSPAIIRITELAQITANIN